MKYISERFTKTEKSIKQKFPDNWESVISEEAILVKYGCPFVLPEQAKWSYITKYASSNEIGSKLNRAFALLEKTNKNLKGLFVDQDYSSKELQQSKLGQVISLFANYSDLTNRDDDFVGQTYEYFLGNFFKKQGQKGGEFYTPKSIVQLLVKVIEPGSGTIYDPACGTGGMFVQSKRYIEKQNGPQNNFLTVYGQESLTKIWKLAHINLLIHGFDGDDVKLGGQAADTFLDDQHPNKKFDFIFANPPFNIKNWGYDYLQKDSRWKWGKPPKGNANYAWLSNILAKLKKQGRAGVVLANGSLTSQNKQEKKMREVFLKENKIEAIISLPDKLFHTVSIPVCLWILNNAKVTTDVLMVHGADFSGEMLSKKLRQLTEKEITRIQKVVAQFRNNQSINEEGFAKSVSKDQIKENDFSFSPGFYAQPLDSQSTTSDDFKQIKNQIRELSDEIETTFNSIKKLEKPLKESIKKIVQK